MCKFKNHGIILLIIDNIKNMLTPDSNLILPNSNFISQDDIIYLHKNLWKNYLGLLDKLFKLWYWERLNVIDFDDTLVSRNEQLNKYEWLAEHRWDLGNIFILASCLKISFEEAMNLSEKQKEEWYRIFVNKFYSNDKVALLWFDLKSKINWILTAWVPMLQRIKLEKTFPEKMPNYTVVSKSSQKPWELIKHIIKIWYIPKEIHIYEDRPEYFEESFEILEKILRTKIYIHKIKINNDTNLAEKIYTKW